MPDAGPVAESASDPESSRPRIGPWRLLLIFSQIAITGFGGVLPFAYRSLVERRKLLTNAQFSEAFALGQLLPGTGLANFVFIVGYRDSGIRGAIAALLGVLALPSLLMLLVAVFYSQYAHVDAVRDAITGMATVTGGLVVATALKLSRGLHRRPARLALLAIAFVTFGLMRLPFLAIIGTLAPLAIWLSWRENKSMEDR